MSRRDRRSTARAASQYPGAPASGIVIVPFAVLAAFVVLAAFAVLLALLVLTAGGGARHGAPSAGGNRISADAAPPIARPASDSGAGARTETTEPRLAPSMQYEDAVAHGRDRITFTPGGRVTVPYSPRASDGWPVGGNAPRTLPTALVSGTEMAADPQGSTWTATGRASAVVSTSTSSVVRAPEAVSASVVAPRTSSTADQASSSLRRQVFGFLPYWELSDPSTSLDYRVLSTVAYFSVGIDPAGNLIKRDPDGTVSTGWGGWTSSDMTRAIDAAHAHGTRVVLTLTLFGWTPGNLASQAAFLGDDAARQRVARQAAAAVRERGADGINIDLEPLAVGHENDFVAFVHELRTALDAAAPGYQLTIDTMAKIGNYPIEAALAAGADAIFIMGYDFRTASADQAGSIAPLSGPVYDVADTLLSYLARVPASKLILGVPYYGRAWSTVSAAPNATTQNGPKYGPSASIMYGSAVPLAEQYGRRWDAREQGPWFAYERDFCTDRWGCITTWREVYYEDPTSLGLKYDLINRFEIRGAGIWALGYEGSRPELDQELVDKFIKDTTPPDSGIKPMPAVQPDEGFVVDWVARDDFSKVASFDVQVSVDGGPWTNWLTGTKAGAEVWFGRDGHSYAFRARATDAKGNVGAWEASSVYVGVPTLAPGGFARAAVDNLTVRAAPSPTATRVDTLASGAIVAITGGPVTAGGYTWYEVTEPISEWPAVALTQSAVWVAAGSTGSPAVYLDPIHAPNSTIVAAGITGLSFAGGGPGSVGPGAAAALRAFSPNGDGSQDTLAIDWTNRQPMAAMTVNVYRSDGTLVESRGIGSRGGGPQSFVWDGKVGGARLSDGTYMLQVAGKSGGATYEAPSARAVSSLELAAFGVTIDTVAPTGHVSISTHVLSPNGDGRLDSLAAAGFATGATKWSFAVEPVDPITGAFGAAVRSASGVPGPGGRVRVTWNGTAADGSVVADGTYRVSFRIMDAAGNGPSGSWTVSVDTQAPSASVSSTPGVISPDRDGIADRAVLAWTSGERATGVVQVLRGKTVVRAWPVGPASGGRLAWNGRDSAGRLLADGRYTVVAIVRDAAGNETRARSAVAVDRTAAVVAWSAPAFYPQDGDALASTARFAFALTRAATTSLRIEDAAGVPVRGAWHDRRQPAGAWSWTWNGRAGDGTLVPPGRYVAVLTVVSPFGTTEVRRTILVDAFAITVSPAGVARGQTLTVTIVSTEGLRSAPSVTFEQAGLAPVKTVARTRGAGRFQAAFTVAPGGTGEATVVVAGRDVAGGVNRSSAIVTIR